VSISFVVKLLFLIALLGALYLVTLGEGAERLADSAIWWQLGLGVLTVWSIYETFFHFKKKEKNKYRSMYPLPDRKNCAICDGELEITKDDKLKCKDCKCLALGIEHPMADVPKAIKEETV
jgi:hypothetical protein